MQRIKEFVQKEVVLCAAFLLAGISALVVRPDSTYIDYIDFRTLGILFCLMCVMAGLQKIGVFQYVAEKLLSFVHGSTQIILLLVLLCFFFSMLITNDVALITFVPFTFTVGRLLGRERYQTMVLPVVVMQTIAANLGSMLTPVGNPQNLYLYGLSGMGTGEFLLLMLPYALFSLLLLIGCCVLFGKYLGRRYPEDSACRTGETLESEDSACRKGETLHSEDSACQKERLQPQAVTISASKYFLIIYLVLFILGMLTVARIVPLLLTLAAVVIAVLLMDRQVFLRVDYCLLLTFVGFFIFIGNMGRLPAFAGLLQGLVEGNEVWVSILASQCISNVPAALLLSGFTSNISGLIVGTNLGGLGTLIASMASLISYKYVAAEVKESGIAGGKGKYFRYFTMANICFLALLVILYMCMCVGVYE
ncbi:MAG: SLC13 family permease [Butyrivibrio sp.]|nr:SLC13 family permease [Butyrivibrio sp.]